MKILIAEDEFVQQRFLNVLLTKAGHEVVAAANGQEAWDILQTDPIRMVLSDWMMPIVDGPELVHRIRTTGWPHYTYIILLTAKDTKDSVVMGLESGADDYLVKPFDRGELIARLAIGERILNLEARLKELATHDSMTGLLNRRALYEIAQGELNRVARTGNTASVILADVDHFKSVNDQYGHPVGDQALCMVAGILARSKRGYDSIGRWGGEEFLILLPQTETDEAVDVAERICTKIAATPLALPDGREVHCSVSLGVSSTVSVAGIPLLDTLLQQADKALYHAKAKGRNRVCRYDDLAS